MTVLDRLRNTTNIEPLDADFIFDAICEASEITSDDEYENADSVEISIRLLDALKNGRCPEGSETAIYHLVEECGLYPYLDRSHFSLINDAALAFNGVNFDEEFLLHAKQRQIIDELLLGTNVVVSAPTSFGKTLLVDAFISERRPNTVVMIVPTIALIDETRRRLIKRFGDKYQVITQRHETPEEDRLSIFVLTQERYLHREDIERIDFLFVDEFYKLDPSRGNDGRYQSLNVALHRAMRITQQVFFAGPNISNINFGDTWNGRLTYFKTSFQTVSINTISRSGADERFGSFLKDIREVEEPSLVYVKSPKSAIDLARNLIEQSVDFSNQTCADLADWIKLNYHPEWTLALALEKGIAIHHGKIPRSLSQLFVELFNDGHVRVLICTSTLIEGVNTSAKNVFVYDKKMGNSDFDYFSFCNIRGRVGRMMRHFVGNVYLYHNEPDGSNTDVDVPIFSNPNEADDYILMNVSPSELDNRGRQRQLQLPFDTGLSKELLRQYGIFGHKALRVVRDNIEKIASKGDGQSLIWTGRPNYNQMRKLAELIKPLMHARPGEPNANRTANQITYFWNQLMRADTLSAFISIFTNDVNAESVDDKLKVCFEFLSSCEFNYPTAVGALSAIIKEVIPDSSHNYSLFETELQNWFWPNWMKEIDESGIPFPLSQKIRQFIGADSNSREVLRVIANLEEERLSAMHPIEQYLIRRSRELVH